MLKLILILFSFNFSHRAWSAACCGAGFSLPSIITSDDKAQLSASVTRSRVSDDVFSNGLWKKREEKDMTDIYRLEGAHIFYDRFQAGLSLNFQRRVRSGAIDGHAQGLGDTTLQLGYETIPDWNYSPYRPKAISYLSAILPTGTSVFETNSSGLEARGRGFYGVGIGTIFTKSIRQIDLNANIEVHHSFEKKVKNKNLKGTIKPGNGSSLSLGGGYNFKKVRLGTLAQWSYEEPVDVRGSVVSRGHFQRFTTLSFMASYLFDHNATLSLSYGDQTLLASPVNTVLTKSLTLFYQQRFSR